MVVSVTVAVSVASGVGVFIGSLLGGCSLPHCVHNNPKLQPSRSVMMSGFMVVGVGVVGE